MTAAPQPILPDSLYTLADFKAITKLGDWALRQARRNGLVVYRYSGRGFILGADFQAFLKAQQTQATEGGT